MVGHVPPFRSRRSRPRRLVRMMPAAALVLGMGVAGCAGVDPPALSINGKELSRDTFEGQLDALATNAALGGNVKVDAPAPGGSDASATGKAPSNLSGQSSDKFRGSTVAAILNTHLQSVVIHDLFMARGLKLPATPDPQAFNQVVQNFGGEAEFVKLPQDVRDLFLNQSLEVEQLIADERAKGPTVEDFFAANRARFVGTDPCVRHILVQTEEQAKEVITRIRGGEDFASVAKISADPGSKDSGGNLGCNSPDSFVPEFAAAVKTAKKGELVGPVQTSFGFHVLEVVEPTVEAFRTQVDGSLRDDAVNRIVPEFNKLLRTAKINVHPALGKVVYSGPDRVPEIQPPSANAS